MKINEMITPLHLTRDYNAGGLTEDDFAADMQTAINAVVAGDTVNVTANSPQFFKQLQLAQLYIFFKLVSINANRSGRTDATASTANFVNGANSGETVYYDPTNPSFLINCSTIGCSRNVI